MSNGLNGKNENIKPSGIRHITCHQHRLTAMAWTYVLEPAPLSLGKYRIENDRIGEQLH